MNKQPVAILYIAIGKYDQFWNSFLTSCEINFMPGVLKTYYVFTDSFSIIPSEQVVRIPVQNEGWPRNTLNRFFFFDSISEKLQQHDYCFFLNANSYFLKPIMAEEVIPSSEQDYLTGLSWFLDRQDVPAAFPYERNPASTAYIPPDKGTAYYQGGFFGGRITEFLTMKDSIVRQIRLDDAHKIIAVNNDESHLNKYLLDKHPRCLSLYYGRPQEWDHPSDPAMVFREKEAVLGPVYLFKLKKKSLGYLFRQWYAGIQSLFVKNN